MNIKLHRALAALCLSGLAGAASANCDSIVDTDYVSALSTNNRAFAAEIISSSPECFGGGPTTGLVQMNGTMFQQASAISSVLAARQAADGPAPVAAAAMRGAAAGGKLGDFNVWGNIGNTDSKQHFASAAPTYAPGGSVRNSMDIMNTVLGVDYAVSPSLLFGVSAAFDDGDGHGGNTSPGFDVNKLNSDGYVIAPYLGWQINREFSLDASAGLGSGQVKAHTTNKVDSDRWYAAANLNYARWVGNWQFTGRASLLHGVEDYGNIKVRGVSQAGTDARNTLDQARLTAQVGYWMGGVMPFVGIGYLNDFYRDSTQFGAPNNPIGHTAWEWRAGANFFSLAHGITGGVVYAQEEGRSKQNSSSLTANINFRF